MFCLFPPSENHVLSTYRFMIDYLVKILDFGWEESLLLLLHHSCLSVCSTCTRRHAAPRAMTMRRVGALGWPHFDLGSDGELRRVLFFWLLISLSGEVSFAEKKRSSLCTF